jgi:hypothetical protein
MFNAIDCDEFQLNKIKKKLEEAAEASTDVFYDIANRIEDLCDYTLSLEKEVEKLNVRLIDNTDEHIILVKNFVERTSQDIAKKKIEQYYSTLDAVKSGLDTIRKWKDEYVKETSNTIIKLQKTIEVNEHDIKQCIKTIFWQSLPTKLIDDQGISWHTFNALTNEGWIKIEEGMFIQALNTSHYELFAEHNDYDITVKTFVKKPLPDALLFSLV